MSSESRSYIQDPVAEAVLQRLVPLLERLAEDARRTLEEALDEPTDSRMLDMLRAAAERHPVRRVTLDDVRRLRTDIRRIATAHGAEEDISVFGSVAVSGSGNDLDLLVTMGPGCGLFALSGMIAALERLLRCRVDVVTPGSLREEIRDHVLRTAVPL